MHRDFTFRKRAILIVLGLLLAGDAGLAIYSWQLSSAPQTPQSVIDAQTLILKGLRGDIKSAQSIKDNMPATRKDCDRFEQSLPSEKTGYSLVTAELDEIARKSGLQLDSLSNKPKELEGRGMVEVSLDATVNGDYGSVVRFVNGLQRSHNFYIIDSLALATDAQNRAPAGSIRVALRLRTYFRDAA